MVTSTVRNEKDKERKKGRKEGRKEERKCYGLIFPTTN